jgi:DNA repair exonuclease SbcCD ATPase subunit
LRPILHVFISEADMIRTCAPAILLLVLMTLPASAASPATAPATDARLGALRDERAKYVARLDEIAREIREKFASVSLGEDFFKPPRPSAELEQLLQLKLEVSRNAADAKAAYDAAVTQVNDGADLPSVQPRISEDANVKSLRQELAVTRANPPPGRLGKIGIEELQRKLDDAVAEVRARVTASILEGLRQQKEATAGQVKTITEKVEAQQADLRDRAERAKKYAELKDDQAATRKSLAKVDADIAELERSSKAAAGIFAGTVDVYLSQQDMRAKTPSIGGATYAGTSELGGHTFVRLSNASGTWSVDPGKIVAVRSSGGDADQSHR